MENIEINESFIQQLPAPPLPLCNNTIPKKKCGRKRKHFSGKSCKREHNKFSEDNLRVKGKYLLLKYLLDFINKKIVRLYNNNIGQGIFKKQLQVLNRSQQSNPSIDYNIKFLYKTLDAIFSEKISSRYTNFLPEHNKEIIQNLKNEEDKEKKNYFNKLFNLTFINCLDHFMGKIFIAELDGLKTFDEIKNDITLNSNEDREYYIYKLKTYLNNYGEFLNNKKLRKSRIEKKNKN